MSKTITNKILFQFFDKTPGTAGERVVTPAVFKCVAPTNIDIGYKPHRLKWKGKDIVTTSQLQRKSKSSGSANV